MIEYVKRCHHLAALLFSCIQIFIDCLRGLELCLPDDPMSPSNTNATLMLFIKEPNTQIQLSIRAEPARISRG